jgi:hypothetical protein
MSFKFPDTWFLLVPFKKFIFILIILLYWGYIVTFTKVLTLYLKFRLLTI